MATIKAFDPYALGAKPAGEIAPVPSVGAETPVFDPTQFGAKPVDVSYGTRVKNEEGVATKNIGETYMKAGDTLTKDWEDYTTKVGATKNPAEKLLHAFSFLGNTAGNIAGTTGSVALSGLRAAIAPLSQIKTAEGDTVGERFAEPVKKTAQAAARAVVEAHPEVAQTILDKAHENPEVARSIGDMLNVLGLTGLGKFAKTKVPGVSPSKIKDAVEATIQDFSFPNVKSIVKQKTGEAVKGIQDSAVSGLETKYYEWGSGTKSGMKKIAKADARTAELDRAGTTGESPQRILAESRIVPEINPENKTKFMTSAQAQEFRDSIRPMQDANAKALEDIAYSVPEVKVSDLETRALAGIRTASMPEGDRAALIKDIQDEFAHITQRYGDTIRVDELNKAKSSYWGGVKFDMTKPFKKDAYYRIASAMQKNVEESAKKAGFDDVAQLNRAIGDRLQAAKYLEDLDGNTLKGGRLQKYVFAGIGATLGGGVAGGILGAIGGAALSQMLISASVSNPVKRMILASIKETQPEVYKATIKWLADQGVIRASQKSLPAPSFIPMGGVKTPVSTAKVLEAKAVSGRNPQSGQFKKFYTSEAKGTPTVMPNSTPARAPQEGIFRYTESATPSVPQETRRVPVSGATIKKGRISK